MEKAIFINKIDNIHKYATKDYSRIYFGEEFCQNRIQEVEDFKKAQEMASELHMYLTLVFPYVIDSGIVEIDDILNELNLEIEGLEIVVNDWGTAYHIRKKYPKLTVIAGRLLNKIKRDPRIKSVEKFLDEEVYNFYRSSNLLTNSSIRFLKEMGIKDVEFDCPMQGINLEKSDLKYSVHFPFGYITTTRLCINNPATYVKGKQYKCTAKLCEKIILKEENSAFSAKVYQVGNTVFYYNDKITREELASMGFERIVEHNEL